MTPKFEDVEVTTRTGAHKGWTEHLFELHGIKWRLLTIEQDRNEPDRSHIYHEDRGNFRSPFWKVFGGRSYGGVISPIGAMRIITDLQDAYERGIEAGKLQKQSEIRSVLGC